MTVPLSPPTPAHVIGSDDEAIEIAHRLAARFAVEAGIRDRERRLPAAELDEFSASGLWGITVPKAYGGAEVSYATVAQVIAIISAADPSIGQIPQNHLGVVNALRLTASEAQKQHYFAKVLQGYRFGNAFSEAKSRNASVFETQLRVDNEHARIDGEKFYCTGALFAHIVPVAAVNEAEQAHIAFVERGTPGMTIIDNWDAIGQRTTASGNVLFDNVRVPLQAVIPAYRAYETPTADGPISQIIQAAVDTGIAAGALEDVRVHARLARPWIDSGNEYGWQDPFVQSSICDLQWRLHATQLILAKAGRAVDRALAEPSEDSVAAASLVVAEAKVLSAHIALLASSKVFELGGTRSALGKHCLDRHWRNARTHTLHDPVRWKYHLIGNHLLNGVTPPRHPWN